ncbi:hypothetical protein [Streptomyces xantholiticus]|uniref:hypothetical protein n=1 Tax=Streptomyces xantholiticus TaxID=68285 RepID=UPI001673B050|nr:hypothetical protein [Streptomyces xantholiticus]GGW58869.1 hypothetical protein GCM10010381_50040 [Streptomyces xantholiticus]
MIRNVIGSILALVGATAAVWSPFRDWYDGRHGRDYRIQDLFGGITPNEGALFTSLLLPMAFAAVVTLVGLLLRSRFMVALAGVIVLGFTVLWMVRQGQESGSLAAGGDGEGLGLGVGLAFGGGVLLLLAAAVMSGRRAPRHRREEPYEEELPGQSPADDWGPYGQDPNAPAPYRDRDADTASYPPYEEPEAPPRHSRFRRH